MIGTMYPEQAEVFINDCVVKGPKSMFSRSTIPGNDQIQVCMEVCDDHSRIAGKSLGKWSDYFRIENGVGDSEVAAIGSGSHN